MQNEKKVSLQKSVGSNKNLTIITIADRIVLVPPG